MPDRSVLLSADVFTPFRKTSGAAAADEESLLQLFWEKWGIREDHLIIRTIDEIPRNTSGKTIYANLKLEDEEKSE